MTPRVEYRQVLAWRPLARRLREMQSLSPRQLSRSQELDLRRLYRLSWTRDAECRIV
ncbi:hypothetical protein PDIG_71470 [Penicillium digitatum PHI26]|uniref:Uncharacterized protein n=2 Tax=Penicillium digitatum TaxID=36651 RepID=K9FHQ3_PEND2|nr:hypothetical protein PDIP_80770 [Penicillium digitatum Pd1]EKV06047.1 hypothetical protein PDIP_80770 [Penicillium digitatum Pd1]EKV07717.1 hypothetical protein PDIG_71470 [Penicillium digitatum PHI26]